MMTVLDFDSFKMMKFLDFDSLHNFYFYYLLFVLNGKLIKFM